LNDELFDELVASVREGSAILRGDRAPSRSFSVDQPDARQIRDQYGLSQNEFAALLGISVATLRNWEQGRRTPEGPARVLLQVAAKHPKAVWDVVRKNQPARREPTHRGRGRAKGKNEKAAGSAYVSTGPGLKKVGG
jgi:putative transcriptional regulator